MKHTSNFTFRDLHILKVLWNRDTMTSEELANLCGVSSKTIRSSMNSLMTRMEESGARIITKKGQGYDVQVEDLKRFTEYMVESYRSVKYSCPDCPEERVLHLLFRLLDGEKISRNAIMKAYVINLATWNKHIKRLKEILDAYRLELKQNKNGKDILFWLEGREYDLRLCFTYRTNWYGYGMIRELGGSSHEYLRLKDYLILLLQKYKLLVRKDLFDDLWTSIYYSVLRTRAGHTCKGLSDQIDYTKPLNGYIVRPAAEQLARWMEGEFHIKVDEDEVLYLQLMLASKMEYGNYMLSNSISLPQEIYDLYMQVLKLLPEEMKAFLSSSKLFELDMCVLMIPIYVRLIHGIYIFSPEMRKLIQTYPEEYEIASRFGPVFEEVGIIPVIEEEMGFLILMIKEINVITRNYVDI